MILAIHITIAFSSLVLAAIVHFYPSRTKLYSAYGLVALTFISGFYLIWANRPVHMTRVCIVGLTYLFLTFFVLASARNKLAKQI